MYPYYFTFTTFTKGRWVGEKILDVFAKEFRAHPVEEYVSVHYPLSPFHAILFNLIYFANDTLYTSDMSIVFGLMVLHIHSRKYLRDWLEFLCTSGSILYCLFIVLEEMWLVDARSGFGSDRILTRVTAHNWMELTWDWQYTKFANVAKMGVREFSRANLILFPELQYLTILAWYGWSIKVSMFFISALNR